MIEIKTEYWPLQSPMDLSNCMIHISSPFLVQYRNRINKAKLRYPDRIISRVKKHAQL